MGILTKPALDDLLARGCSCRGTKLNFSTYVDGRFTLLSGDEFGTVVWVYKGETFVDGIYEIACASCKRKLFSSDACPRCNREGALADVLEAPNRVPLPAACPTCSSETLLYTAMVPAHVVYEGKRAQKARALVDLVEEGGARPTRRVQGVRSRGRGDGAVPLVRRAGATSGAAGLRRGQSALRRS